MLPVGRDLDGKRGDNEFTTAVWCYLKRVDQEGNIKNVNLFCDSCPGQNRNKILISSLPVILSSLQTIQVTFLLPGLTSMPVDSVHSTIEFFFLILHPTAGPNEEPYLLSFLLLLFLMCVCCL